MPMTRWPRFCTVIPCFWSVASAFSTSPLKEAAEPVDPLLEIGSDIHVLPLGMEFWPGMLTET